MNMATELTVSQRLETVAAHEAGHCIAALEFGLRAREIRIESFSNGARLRGVSGIQGFNALDMTRQYRIVYGGVAAENAARARLGLAIVGALGSDATRLRPDDFTARFDKAQHEHARKTARELADGLIEDESPILEALTSLIVNESELEDDERPGYSLRWVPETAILNCLTANRHKIKSWSIRGLIEQHYDAALAAHEAAR